MIDVLPNASSSPRGTLDRLAALTARLLAVPIAILSLGDDDVRSGAGSAESGEWAMAVTSPDIHRITSTLADPHLLTLPTVAEELFAFHAAEPIVTAAGWAFQAEADLRRANEELARRVAASGVPTAR